MLPRRSTASGRLRRGVQGALAVLGAELVLLALTGVALWFVYTPTGTPEWDDVNPVTGTAGLAAAVRQFHRVMSWLAVVTALVAAVLTTLVASRPWRRTLLGGAAMLAVALAAFYTGTLVTWDQLALWAVTVGTDFEGYRPLPGDQVRSVLVDGNEVSTATLLRWLAVHVALGASALLLTGYAWRRARDGSGPALLDDEAGSEG